MVSSLRGFEGYWISPHGDVYEVEEHIKFMHDNPGIFGLQSDDPRFIRVPGSTNRADLVIEALRKGWIRVRVSGRGNDMVNVWRMDAKTVDNLMKLYEKQPIASWEKRVDFSEFATGRLWTSTMKELLAALMAEKSKSPEMLQVLERVAVTANLLTIQD